MIKKPVCTTTLMIFAFTATANAEYICLQRSQAVTRSWRSLAGSSVQENIYICEYDEICNSSRAYCHKHGKCLLSPTITQYRCYCDAGFTGNNCTVNIDDCASNPCQNTATCVDGINAYTCDCVAGFNGTHCETDIDDCTANFCHTGTCIDHVNGYSCNCTDTGFTGLNCETEIDECASDPCVNGICIDRLSNYVCNCTDSGFIGSLCEIDECAIDTTCDVAKHSSDAGGYDNKGSSFTCMTTYEFPDFRPTPSPCTQKLWRRL